MNTNKYNGYTNYETWLYSMFLDGNYTGCGTYQYYLYLVEDIMNNDEITEKTIYLADLLKDEIDECNPFTEDMELFKKYGNSVFCDLLNAAISEINFYELACKLIEQYNKNL